MRHRGPDDHGLTTLPVSGTPQIVSLMHRRLAVIDLTANAHQPMTNEDKFLWIVFNGEIYNFPCLRDELLARGHTFRSRSDTEVILHGYEEWGETIVEKIHGMFAFAIWDSRTNSLFIARDRVGKKPLFYFKSDEAFACGSEIKSILASGLVRAELDPDALHDYLTYLYYPAPRTAYKNIHKLEPGHCLLVKIDTSGRITSRSWKFWDLLAAPQDPAASSESTAIARLREIMDDAVRSRLISDVPIGVTLSGGMDSSTITALMSRASDAPINTFTVGFNNENYNEVPQANFLANYFKTNHRVIEVNASCSQELSTVIRHFDEPFGNPTAILELILARVMREHVTVALTGDGADESMAGYPRYMGGRFAGYVRKLPRTITRNLLAPLGSTISDSTTGRHSARRVREFLQSAWMDEEESYLGWIGYFTESEKRELYTPELSRQVGDRDSGDLIRRHFRDAASLDPVNRFGYVDVMTFLTFNCLEYADRMSMANSLELRCPFTDHRFLEFAFQVSGDWKIKGLTMKNAMCRAMADLLPNEVLRRKKIGFNPPMAAWIDRELRGMIAYTLSPQAVAQRGLFRPETVAQILADHWSHKRDNGLKIWALLMIEIWFRMYIEGQSSEDVTAQLAAVPNY